MDKLKQHIEWLLAQCRKDSKELWMHQAFGAVQFYAMIIESREAYEELEAMWNNIYKPAFESCIWGQKMSL